MGGWHAPSSALSRWPRCKASAACWHHGSSASASRKLRMARSYRSMFWHATPRLAHRAASTCVIEKRRGQGSENRESKSERAGFRESAGCGATNSEEVEGQKSRNNAEGGKEEGAYLRLLRARVDGHAVRAVHGLLHCDVVVAKQVERLGPFLARQL